MKALSVSLDAGCGQHWPDRMFRHKQVSNLERTDRAAAVEEWTDKQANKHYYLISSLQTAIM